MRTLERRQGLRVSCPEEIAFQMGFISRDDLERLGRELEKSDYGRYLLAIAGEASLPLKAWVNTSPRFRSA